MMQKGIRFMEKKFNIKIGLGGWILITIALIFLATSC